MRADAYVWADGTWCWADELNQMNHKSDDYYPVELPEWADENDMEIIASRQLRNSDIELHGLLGTL